MTLSELQRIKQWHVKNGRVCPLQYHLWDAMLTLWLMGWVGWLPAFAFDALWCVPLLLLGMSAPDMYVAWRLRAHQLQRVRCDWVRPPRQSPRQ